jgi:hypothetical protein
MPGKSCRRSHTSRRSRNSCTHCPGSKVDRSLRMRNTFPRSTLARRDISRRGSMAGRGRRMLGTYRRCTLAPRHTRLRGSMAGRGRRTRSTCPRSKRAPSCSGCSRSTIDRCLRTPCRRWSRCRPCRARSAARRRRMSSPSAPWCRSTRRCRCRPRSTAALCLRTRRTVRTRGTRHP